MREVDVSHARSGGSSLDARDRARDARHGNLRSPSTRDWSGARSALFPRIALAKAYVEGDDARVTHPALLQLRHHIGRDQVDGDAEVGSHPSPQRRHQHQARPTRSDGGWRRGRLSIRFILVARASPRGPTQIITHHLTLRRFFEGSGVSSKRARSKACVTTIRARQLGSPWRPAQVHARGVCSARSAQRALPCPRFVPACCAIEPPEISRAPQRTDESFVWFETSRAPASRRVFHV